jgi:oligopeptide transport system permease protein
MMKKIFAPVAAWFSAHKATIFFLLKRILSSLVTMFVIIAATFFLMHAVPGGPFATNEKLSRGMVAAMEAKYGLDKPIMVQFGKYLWNLMHFDFGLSIASKEGKTVNDIINLKFPVSAGLGGLAILVALGLGLTLGCAAALNHEKWLDRAVMFISTLGIAVPGFIMGMLLLLLFGVALRWLGFIGLNSPADYILPTFTLAFYPACFIARLTRSSLLDVLGQDYIRTARAKGMPRKIVLVKHAMRNAMLPVVTYLGPLIAYVLVGSFVVERIFSIPGLGQFFVNSITSRDYPLIMGTTIFLAALIIFMNLLVDMVYAVIDPRIKLK